MVRFLPILLLSLIAYRLSLITPSFAQEANITVNATSQLYPQGLDFETFFKNLTPDFNKIPKTLEQTNCSFLPNETCGEIKVEKTKASLKTQAKEETDNKETVGKAAAQYVIGSGTQNPSEVSRASTNVVLDFLSNIVDAILGIFNRGEKEAKNYAGGVLPQDVTQQNFAQGFENISGYASSDNTDVLGAQTGKSAMEKALPLRQCAELPAEVAANLCNF